MVGNLDSSLSQVILIPVPSNVILIFLHKRRNFLSRLSVRSLGLSIPFKLTTEDR